MNWMSRSCENSLSPRSEQNGSHFCLQWTSGSPLDGQVVRDEPATELRILHRERISVARKVFALTRRPCHSTCRGYGIRPGENPPANLGAVVRTSSTVLFDAAHHFAPFASHPYTTTCAHHPTICIRTRTTQTDAWSIKTIPARKGANTRAVMAHA